MPLLPIAIGAGGSLLSSIFGSSQAKKQRDANRRAEADARAHNKEMWNLQNEYNHPSAQMSRLQEAGLNPNMIYGTSPSSAVGAAGDIAKGQAPDQDYHKQLDLDPMQAMVQHQNIEQSKAQSDNLRTQNSVFTQEALLKQSQRAQNLVNTAKSEFDLMIAKELKETSLEAARENLRVLKQDTMGRELDNYFKDKTMSDRVQSIALQVQNANETLTGTQLANKMKQFEVELNQLGITKSDPLYMRLMQTGQLPKMDRKLDSWLDKSIFDVGDRIRDLFGDDFKQRFPKR